MNYIENFLKGKVIGVTAHLDLTSPVPTTQY